MHGLRLFGCVKRPSVRSHLTDGLARFPPWGNGSHRVLDDTEEARCLHAPAPRSVLRRFLLNGRGLALSDSDLAGSEVHSQVLLLTDPDRVEARKDGFVADLAS